MIFIKFIFIPVISYQCKLLNTHYLIVSLDFDHHDS